MESVRFYTEVFGMEKIPTYTFGFAVQHLRLGDLQLHIFERETKPPTYHHIGIDVDDFEAAYAKAMELDTPFPGVGAEALSRHKHYSHPPLTRLKPRLCPVYNRLYKLSRNL